MDIVQYIYHGPNKLYTSDGSCT